MGKFSKRNKSYYINKSRRYHKEGTLGPNMVGFLCTCLKNENSCATEAISLLAEFVSRLESDKDQRHASCIINSEDSATSLDISKENDKHEEDDLEDSDIDSDLKSGLESLRKLPVKPTLLFVPRRVSVNNCVFIETSLKNPIELSIAIMNHLKETKVIRTHHICRMIPVLKTCKSYFENIEKSAQELLLEYLPKTSTSFCILCNFRNNTSIKKDSLLISLSNFAMKINPNLHVNYKTPDLVLSIDILQKICCLSLLPHYLTMYHKYNLKKITTKPSFISS